MAFKASDFGKFVLSDPRAKRLTRRIAEVAADTTKTADEKFMFMLENIEGLDTTTARAFAEADSESKVLGLLGEASARLTTNPADVLLPTDIRDIRLSGYRAALDDAAKDRFGLYRNIRNSRWFETIPKAQVVIRGSGADKTEAVKTYARYLRGINFGDETPEFKSVMYKVS